MTKRVVELRVPVKKRYALMYPLPATEMEDGELGQSGGATLQRTDEEVNEIRRRKALSHAIRLRVAEMQQPVTKRFAPLKGQMSPLSATENSEGAQKQSGVEAFQSTVNRRLLKLEKKARKREHKKTYNKRTSWTWTKHFRLHHTVWMSNYILRYVALSKKITQARPKT
jgi:hypothetical protein